MIPRSRVVLTVQPSFPLERGSNLLAWASVPVEIPPQSCGTPAPKPPIISLADTTLSE